MLAKFTMAVIIFLSSKAYCLAMSGEAGQHCLREHLEDAIKINTERLPIYSEWTGGRSEVISKMLIRSEQLSLLMARMIEPIDRKLKESNIEIFCQALVSMDDIPSQERDDELQEIALFQPAKVKGYPAQLLAAWRKGSYEGLAEKSRELVAELEPASDYHCMLRHLVESIGREAAYAPWQLDLAKKNKQSFLTQSIIDTYLTTQLGLLPLANSLDIKAAPLQAEGVGIICRDVPKIDIPIFKKTI